MSNLAERIATRNTCEKFYVERLYPVLNALMLDIAQRQLDGEKMILASGQFSKAAQKIIDPVVAELHAEAPKPVRFFISVQNGDLHAKADYWLPLAGYQWLHIPTVELSQSYVDRIKSLAPPVFSPVSEALLTDCRATVRRVREEIEALQEVLATAESTLRNVGEPT